MKVKTFTLMIALIFLLAMLAVAHYAQDSRLNTISPQDTRPNTSSIAMPTATEEPDTKDSGPMMPEPLAGLSLPIVNEPSLNPTPVGPSKNSEAIIGLAMTPTPPIDPRSTPMAPMKPMEPWKPAAPMTGYGTAGS